MQEGHGWAAGARSHSLLQVDAVSKVRLGTDVLVEVVAGMERRLARTDSAGLVEVLERLHLSVVGRHQE